MFKKDFPGEWINIKLFQNNIIDRQPKRLLVGYSSKKGGHRMEGVYFRQQLGEGINLYLVREPKFKTVSMSIVMYRPLDENSTGNALIPHILKRGCEDLRDTRAIQRFLGQRYGASLNVDVLKKGDMQLIFLGSSVISNKYTIKGEGVVSDILKFLAGLVERPLIEQDRFRDEYFVQERDNLERLINSRINDKIQYSIDRCYEETTKGQPFSRYRYGDAGDLSRLTAEGLAGYYRTVLAEAPMDIFVVGDVDIADIRDFLDSPPALGERKVKCPEGTVSPQWDGAPREVVERMDVNQGKLTIGYTTGIDYTHNQYVPLLVYASILGGGPHSKLFNNVREKASLAYYTFARLEKLKGLMVIGAGIEISDYQKTVAIIEEQLRHMRNGNISDSELIAAKMALTNGLHSMKDSQMQITDFLINRIVSGHNMTPDDLIERINEVTKDDVVAVADGIKHAVTYFLTGDGKAGKEEAR
jgi:predicted Zn-dependent peptidase